jgi:hypothetical protein
MFSLSIPVLIACRLASSKDFDRLPLRIQRHQNIGHPNMSQNHHAGDCISDVRCVSMVG